VVAVRALPFRGHCTGDHNFPARDPGSIAERC
jgi:hypothetical protein